MTQEQRKNLYFPTLEHADNHGRVYMLPYATFITTLKKLRELMEIEHNINKHLMRLDPDFSSFSAIWAVDLQVKLLIEAMKIDENDDFAIEMIYGSIYEDENHPYKIWLGRKDGDEEEWIIIGLEEIYIFLVNEHCGKLLKEQYKYYEAMEREMRE